MKTKFTKGPWNLEMPKKKKNYAKLSGDGWLLFAKICVRIKGHKEPDEEGLANAKLIAAAPDLFEALLGLKVFIDGLPPMSAILFSLTEEYNKAEQAIKKATE